MSDSTKGNRLLVLHGGALGDCVLAMHVLGALRQSENAMCVTLAARSGIARWAARRRLIDEATTLEAIGVQELFRSVPESEADCRLSNVDCRLRGQRHADTGDLRGFDFVISFLGGPDAEVSRRLIDICGRERVAAIDPRPTAETLRDGVHITDQWAAEIRRHGFDLKFDISEGAPFTHLPNRQITKSVLVHPGSGGRSKCCPIEALETIVRELSRQGWTVSWMIGPDEVERDGPEFRSRLEASARVVFEESIEAAADFVAGADAYIGNDAGMTHVAALAGVTTVALFGPTDPRVWRPLGARCTVMPFPESGNRRSDWTAAILRHIAD